MGKRIELNVIYRPKKATRAALPKLVEAIKAKTTPKPKMGRPATGFDKKEYQRLYMRDKTQADKAGLSVKAWRQKAKA